MTRAERHLAVAVGLIWPVLGTIFFLMSGLPLNPQTAAENLAPEIAWAVATPFLFKLSGRIPGRPRAAALGAYAGVVVSCIAGSFLFERMIGWLTGMPSSLIARHVGLSLLRCSVIAAAAGALRRERRLHRQARAAARAEQLLAAAEEVRVTLSLDDTAIVATLHSIEQEIESSPREAEEHMLELCRTLRTRLGRLKMALGAFRPIPQYRERPLRRGAVPLLYPAFAAVLSATIAVQSAGAGAPVRWMSLLDLMVIFTMAGATSPLLVAVSIHTATDRWPLQARIAVLPLASVGHGAVTSLCVAAVGRLGRVAPHPMLGFFMVVTLSLAVSTSLQFSEYASRARRAALAAARLKRTVAEARARMLQCQLAPHFLFNTLNTITAYIYRAPATARDMLRRLAQLFIATAEQRSQSEVPVRQELEMTRAYVEIEQVRFRDVLDVRFEVDPLALDLMAPPFLLQPLVENAIRHGILSTSNRRSVSIRLHATASHLQLEVENDAAPGVPESWRPGIGLSNVRALLALWYGDAHDLAIETTGTAGVRLRIRIPARLAVS